MNAQALKATGSTWVRILAVALILAALALTAGAACGGDGDDRDSRSTSRSSEEREFARDSEEREEREEDDRESSRDDEEDEAHERDSSGSRIFDRTGRGVSVQDLGSVPNLEYRNLALVDVSALLYGDIPKAVTAVSGINETWMDLAKVLGETRDKPIGISMEDVETFIFVEWDDSFDDAGEAFTIQGEYSLDTVSDSLGSSSKHERIQGEDIDYEAWEYEAGSYSYTVAFVHDRVYGVDNNFERSSEFLTTLLQEDWLLDHLDNTVVRLVDRAGPGWLVLVRAGDWSGRCRLYGIEDECLGMAFAASTGSESYVEGTYVFLFDTSENANATQREIEERIDASEDFSSRAENHWITEMNTDGEFLVLKGSVPAEEAAKLLQNIIDQLNLP